MPMDNSLPNNILVKILYLILFASQPLNELQVLAQSFDLSYRCSTKEESQQISRVRDSDP